MLGVCDLNCKFFIRTIGPVLPVLNQQYAKSINCYEATSFETKIETSKYEEFSNPFISYLLGANGGGGVTKGILILQLVPISNILWSRHHCSCE